MRGLIRISYGAGGVEGGEGDWSKKKKSAEVGATKGQSTSRSDRWQGKEKQGGGRGEVSSVTQTCSNIKVPGQPCLIFHHTPKFKM